MELMPGLPDDAAYQCLLRVTYDKLATVASVCKGWRGEIELPEFRRRRREICKSQKLVVVAQATVGLNPCCPLAKYRTPVYRFSLLEPETGCWSELALPPEFEHGLPMFCQVASVGLALVVLGGMDPVTWEVSSSVFIFDFISGTWRRGHDMPGSRRQFFGCTSDSDRTVYVVGGHDDDKNALKSTMAYDVAKDEWVLLPDMARERDECKTIFQRGKLHVVGGYCTERQGQFETSAEVFDIATCQWEQVQENFLETPTCPRTCIGGNDGQLYTCRGSDVVALKESKWQTVAKLPADVGNVAYLVQWLDKLLAIGSAGFGQFCKAFVLDLKSYKWTEVRTPEEFSGPVQSGCYLEI
ncbi:hypothetical protein K2173_024494 [Erythroxylum novogranatense]|uniref:F-box/kelch-repeat protein n=1 Tax=Erythroxylum novogranatense TaxID=1862640 RepID=A0AAV8SVH7_9ROSI|nr:hypothetical protein K2173_024494 [Erythroxylum novogranatense]